MLTLILLISFNSWAYFIDDAKIHPSSFRRYIRPQASSIIQDYYTTLKLLQNNGEQGYELKKTLRKTRAQLITLKQTCPTYLSLDCKQDISAISEGLAEFEKNFIIFGQTLNCNAQNIDYCLEQIQKNNQLHKETLKIMAQFDEIKLLLDKKEKLFLTTDLEKKYNEFEFFFHNFQITMLDKEYQEAFQKIYRFFIEPMETWYLTDKENLDFFVTNIEGFNKTVNEFNFNINKKMADDLPKGVGVMVKTIHNRWNSILRIILRS